MAATQEANVTGKYVDLDGERYFRIANCHRLPEFFMSLVGVSDHWMFVSSHGALTAGRCDPDSALFPYAADDQISVARHETGPVTLIRIEQNASGDFRLWEPFSAGSIADQQVVRNIYKTPLGNKLVFEELNEGLQLSFRYRWAFSEKFGFVRSCKLENFGIQSRSIDLLDGLRNILPYGVGSDFMMRFSNLANAYKKSELLEQSKIGLFYLSSIPTDRAEPSEGLKATTAWQTGLSPAATLLSTSQIPNFCAGHNVASEFDIRGKAGAYLCHQQVTLEPGESLEWDMVAELEQDHSEVVALDEFLLQSTNPSAELASDVELGETDFLRILSSSDALQCGANDARSNRHLSSTVFNVMRGGIPLDDYQVHADDFRQHVANFNKPLSDRQQTLLEELPEALSSDELKSRSVDAADPDLIRLAYEYLPLAFSRRHGDPTRPWNRFAIHLRSDSGRTNLNYQGNWRDIFQNWEALAVSFPSFTPAMICRFVNATTADGYNPYRVTKGGFEWEEPSPEDPWANIGYWGDHQIIYLLKLLEWNHKTDPAGLLALLQSRTFVHANVPYRIKPYSEILQDPQDTIEFDAALSQSIADRVANLGADGKLVRNGNDEIHRVNLIEKLLILSLAKLSNFIPDGGIWLNTQRPEWNDANNALVGNGLSMVTTCYLYRWFDFLESWLEEAELSEIELSVEVASFLQNVADRLAKHATSLSQAVNPSVRREIVDDLSNAGSEYRQALYAQGPSGDFVRTSKDSCIQLFAAAKDALASTIRKNRREDGLYHSYNLLKLGEQSLEVEYLYEMLEGQVAVLSSGLLSPEEAANVLDAMRESLLFRENQESYMLYPDRQLPRFMEKNSLSESEIAECELLVRLLQDGNTAVVKRDIRGQIHFNGAFKNSYDLKAALDRLPSQYDPLLESGSDQVVALFEEHFGHRQFTGRSGTFFAYEGLGSIYWHMVSKISLAVAENFFAAVAQDADNNTVNRLQNHFQDVRRGIGAEKTPSEYGAFPSDPYSHTPENAGVKQPGMTGQVKEDILSRFAEIGVHIENGQLHFRMDLFDHSELLDDAREFRYFDIQGNSQTLSLPAGAFGFTLCQVPVTLTKADSDTLCVHFANGDKKTFTSLYVDQETTQTLFSRDGTITSIECSFA